MTILIPPQGGTTKPFMKSHEAFNIGMLYIIWSNVTPQSWISIIAAILGVSWTFSALVKAIKES